MKRRRKSSSSAMKNRPSGFVTQSVQAASMADEIKHLLDCVLGRQIPVRPIPERPPLAAWLPMYRRHRAMNDAVGWGMGVPPGVVPSEVLGEIRKFLRASPEVQRAVIEALPPEEKKLMLKLIKGLPFPPNESELRSMLDQLEEDPFELEEDGSALMNSLMGSPEGQYFYCVWIPCWMLYRKVPPILLRMARQGDNRAFEKLLRLDKSIVSDPVLAGRWHQVMHSGKKRRIKELHNAMAGKPLGKTDKKSIRLGLSGLITQLAYTYRCKVTNPEIRALFDGIAKIRTGKIDTALPLSPEAFAKGNQRNRNFPSLPKQRL